MNEQRSGRSHRARLIRLSISAAANGLSRNRLATVAATTTMTLMLMVLASVLVIRAGLDAALSFADSKVEVIAYLKSTITESQADALQGQIEGIDGVKEARFVSADEALADGAGVCQDFAHVQIAALRAHGLAAAYVSGYIRTVHSKEEMALRGADASHAWVAVWCGRDAGWVHLDPTNDLVAREDHVVVAWGRDFADVSPLRGVIDRKSVV